MSPGWEELAVTGWARLVDQNGRPVDEYWCAARRHPFCYLLVHKGEAWKN